MVIKTLKSIGCSFLDANQIALESVVRTEEGFSLPYGFVQSPMLASLCLDKSRAGLFLRELQRDVALSVFVDDVIISHPNDVDKLERASMNLLAVFRASGFPVSEEKCEICKDAITSFNIRVSHANLEVTRERMDQFEADIRLNVGNEPVTTGIINYVRSINIQQAEQLSQLLVR